MLSVIGLRYKLYYGIVAPKNVNNLTTQVLNSNVSWEAHWVVLEPVHQTKHTNHIMKKIADGEEQEIEVLSPFSSCKHLVLQISEGKMVR